MHRIVITGGAGFIGSHVTERIARDYPDARIVIVDKMTYAADIQNLAGVLDWRQRHLKVGDVCDFEFCLSVTKDADCVIHLAAESHVDNSFGNSMQFTRSNTLGTHTLLEACRLNNVPRIVHVSTDEVYGEIAEGYHTESSILNPTNPYSASKAAADMVAMSYIRSFSLPLLIVRSNNVFGIRQFPEKIIPRFILCGLRGEKMPLHGSGEHRRRFLAVEDFSEAISMLVKSGAPHEIYNIGAEEEYATREIARMICRELDLPFEGTVVFTPDRPFNDCRYAVNSDKLEAMGWKPRVYLSQALKGIVDWYREHQDRYVSVPTALSG